MESQLHQSVCSCPYYSAALRPLNVDDLGLFLGLLDRIMSRQHCSQFDTGRARTASLVVLHSTVMLSISDVEFCLGFTNAKVACNQVCDTRLNLGAGHEHSYKLDWLDRSMDPIISELWTVAQGARDFAGVYPLDCPYWTGLFRF